MSEQVEITIKIPVSYFEKLRLESITETTAAVETATAAAETVVAAKNEFMNIINQLPDMVKNMLPKDLEKMSKDEQKTFVITLTKNYPQMKEMVSEKMINDLSSYFQCKAAELGFVKKFKYQQESPAPTASQTAPTASQTAPAAPQTAQAVPQMQDMFAGLMGMMKPPAPLKEGETPPPQPSMQDFLAGFMGMMQQNASAATVGTAVATSATTTATTATTATTTAGSSIEEAD